MYSSSILTSTKLLYLAAGAALVWACAKGVEIDEADVVFISGPSGVGADAGADAGVAGSEPAAAEQPASR